MKFLAFVVMLALSSLHAKADRKLKIHHHEKGDDVIAEAKDLLQTVHDSAIVEEAIQFEKAKSGIPERDYLSASRYTWDIEIPKRARKNQKLANQLLGILDSQSVPTSAKHAVLRNFWRIRGAQDPSAGEQILRNVASRASEESSVRFMALHRLTVPSKENLEFVSKLIDSLSNTEQVCFTARKLGRLAVMMPGDSGDEMREREKAHLIGLRAHGKLNLANLSGTLLFSRKHKDIEFIKSELENEKFADFENVLMPIRDSIECAYVGQIYLHQKGTQELRNSDFFGDLSRRCLEKVKVKPQFSNQQEKLHFLMIYECSHGRGNSTLADSTALGLLRDSDIIVRYNAALAAHYSLPSRNVVLHQMYSGETADTIRALLHENGYSE